MTILPNSPDLVGAANLTWQQHMKLAIRTADELAFRLNLPSDVICDKASESFPLFVPLPYLDRIEVGNVDDPLLRQVLPSQLEDSNQESGSTDPVAESEFTTEPGLLQKYQGRALMVVNGVCAIHCRYCFRRHFPYDALASGKGNWQAPLEAIAADSNIQEVILSGGDPLTLVDDQISELIDQIDSIDHVKRIRIHTRLPIVIPQRVTQRLISTLQGSRSDIVIVVHCNHAQEIDVEVSNALKDLKSCANAVLNQSVLLTGINDDIESLCSLSERLIESGVVPYYLHQFDPVKGAMHFEAPEEKGKEIIRAMRSRLPGYMVPRYVREIPGRPAKTILA